VPGRYNEVICPVQHLCHPAHHRRLGLDQCLDRVEATVVTHFGPQVAVEAGWNKEKFMTSLCANKAGLPPDAWKDPSTDVYIFEAEVFGEE
ncbi:MAG: AMMECR1 family protein, partial [Candidatus Omnitrophica bacterium]|nr:AMMECR1 family protein [Candidatus Omnitrophota bacterium]